MSKFIRFSILGLFAAGGTGFAIALATSPETLQQFLKTTPLLPTVQTLSQDLHPAKSSTPGNTPAPAAAAQQRGRGNPFAENTMPLRAQPQPAVTQQAAPSPSLGGLNLGEVLQSLEKLQAGMNQAQNGPQPQQDSSALLQKIQSQLPSAQTANGAGPGPKAADSQTATPRGRAEIIPGEGDQGLSITIQGADIREVLELLSEQGGLNILTSKSVTGTVSASLKGVDVETALDAILRSTGYLWRRDGKFIYVGTPQDFKIMNQTSDHIATRLYRPNYVKAADLQVLLTPLLTESIGTISVSTPAQIGIGSDPDNVGGDAFAGQEALLVRDFETVLIECDQLVAKIDRRPTQVQIEAMILSVKIDDNNTLGVNFELLRKNENIRITSGNPLSNLATLDTSDGGLKVGFLDSSLSALVEALETVGDTNVIATPRLMCLNKHRAEIHIGAELGYVSKELNDIGGSETSVQFLQVGTKLRIRPFISSDGIIRMEVHPELSTGAVRLEGGFTLPDKELTEVTTNILVGDGSTVVIGGLIRDQLKQTTTQIPYLGSMPVLGPIFRQNTEDTERQEILVLITPRIVYEPELSQEGNRSAGEFLHRHAVYADKMNLLGKRYIGRKFFRLARDAWSDNRQQEALRLANLAIHYDPLNRAAIDLRADIVSGNHVGDHTFRPDEVHAPNASSFEGKPVAPWLLNRLEIQQPAPPPIHPIDPGQPGPKYDIITPRRIK